MGGGPGCLLGRGAGGGERAGRAGRYDADAPDNTLASAFDAVVRVARQAKIPLFTYDTSAVERGAIAAYAQNQHQAGVDWARDVAVPVLLGKPAGTIVPVPYKAFDLLLNSSAAEAAGITLPPEMIKSAIRVYKN